MTVSPIPSLGPTREQVARVLWERGKHTTDFEAYDEDPETRDWMLGHADAILALYPVEAGDGGGWRPIDTLPHPQDAGRFWAAIRVKKNGGPERWEIDLIALDDETHEIDANYYVGWDISQYELWQPCIVPASPPLAEGEPAS